MYVVTVEFEVKPQHVLSFREAISSQAVNSLGLEQACRQFDVCFDPENECLCFLYEQYDDRKAFDTHLASNHFQQFEAMVAAWVIRKTVKTWVQETPATS